MTPEEEEGMHEVRHVLSTEYRATLGQNTHPCATARVISCESGHCGCLSGAGYFHG